MITKQGALTKVFGDPQKKMLKRLEKRVASVNALEDKYKKFSKVDLKKQTEILKKRLAKKGTTLDSLLPDSFALVREASDRVLGMRHFDVQLIGAMVLHEGDVAEMKTGEGKTLVATLAVFLNALEEKCYHQRCFVCIRPKVR
jgi:preprotein translocase subunit SecA